MWRTKKPEVNKELYQTSKQIVAPVIAGFADQLLKEANGSKIIFAARDGLAPYAAAQELASKFDYNVTEENLVYAYLTRKVVWSTPPKEMARYLEQSGINPDDDAILADIGMYGSFMPSMQQVLPKMQPRYLISRHPDIPGYADSLHNPRMSSMSQIIGNKAVHFLEDTYSGEMPSPSHLIEIDDHLAPNTIGETYPGPILQKRQIALQGIVDYTRELSDRPPQDNSEAISRLDNLLIDHQNFEHLMVPHEK